MAEQPALEFGGLLRQLRAQAKLTQEELAEAAGLSPRSVSDLERGVNRTARKDTAVLLADALDLAEPVRDWFVAAARGRVMVPEVLAVMRGEALGAATTTRPAAGESAAAGVHGFAPALTSFTGRAGAVREVVGLLEEYRLVTVAGPGGSGKTRLAEKVAGRVAGRFADGVWLVELAAARDPAQVPAMVAAALGVRDVPGVPAADALARVLSRQQLLLVLDNCEHVIGAAAELCAGLLLACDDMRVLATSREPLRVAGEARYRLAPLALPSPDDPADIAVRCEAVALFADRARRADARFTMDAESGLAVGRLVARLDGMPLAIELAAARVEALGLAQLVDRLDDRFALLASGDRLAADRHQSLAAMVEWSYQLLSEQERQVFRLVSVFPGPFTLEAAEAVAGEGAGPLVLHLVDCSLLVPPQAGPDGRARYGMLETLRAYGAQLLARAGEQDRAGAALAGYALRVAEQAASGLATSTAEAAAARWLDTEDATTRQALAWGMEHDPGTALRLAVTLAPWWLLRGRLAGQQSLLLQLAGRGAPGSEEWCAAQFWLGSSATLFSADLAGALVHFTAVCDAIGGQGPSRALADSLASRSVALSNLGRIAEAEAEARGALAVARQLGYPAGEALALERLGIAAWFAGDLKNSVRLARQAEQVPGEIPGWIARNCRIFLASVLIASGELAAAEHICTRGLVQSRDTNDLWSQAKLLIEMAALELWAARTADAATYLREALQISARIGERYALGSGLDCCGYLCAATGRPAEAVTVWAAFATLLLHGGAEDAPADARRRQGPLRKARQALGPARARAAEDRGAAMSWATATEYGLMLTNADPQPILVPAPAKLSAREQELVTLVARGRTDADIAAQLYISIRTVRSHLDQIRDKTGCRRRTDLTRLALSTGII
jgi:predicted ATPase/DNA-binding CsgD family transcriptional regulator/transcriptional regulator with XRE-family HTH domain